MLVAKRPLRVDDAQGNPIKVEVGEMFETNEQTAIDLESRGLAYRYVAKAIHGSPENKMMVVAEDKSEIDGDLQFINKVEEQLRNGAQFTRRRR